MIHQREKVQNSMEIVMLEQLVLQDHILRKIDKYIDFSFIKDLTYDLYCHTNGRPGVDPENYDSRERKSSKCYGNSYARAISSTRPYFKEN